MSEENTENNKWGAISGLIVVIFKKLGLLTVPGLIIKEACLLVKENLFCLNNSLNVEKAYNTRKEETRINKNDDFKSNLNFCIQVYNKLPENLKREENRQIFKRRVTEYLCGRCLYSIDEFFEQWLVARVRNVC